MTAVYDRYQVGDELCGFIEAFQTKDEALAHAAFHNAYGQPGEPEATVMDIMAHRGAPEIWLADGRIKSRRPLVELVPA